MAPTGMGKARPRMANHAPVSCTASGNSSRSPLFLNLRSSSVSSDSEPADVGPVSVSSAMPAAATMRSGVGAGGVPVSSPCLLILCLDQARHHLGVARRDNARPGSNPPPLTNSSWTRRHPRSDLAAAHGLRPRREIKRADRAAARSICHGRPGLARLGRRGRVRTSRAWAETLLLRHGHGASSQSKVLDWTGTAALPRCLQRRLTKKIVIQTCKIFIYRDLVLIRLQVQGQLLFLQMRSYKLQQGILECLKQWIQRTSWTRL
ncbi:uncharacterized protein LOC119333821 [Triticum dicoccoides]|uniref:uncharacterized protein LOC119333821 n=1 Tax=Triticum dicoccoides TaxID=85692 RepID=UPI0018914A29|nr:uncharacterized protein LOC119333821 [Triticum dicoccoides]